MEFILNNSNYLSITFKSEDNYFIFSLSEIKPYYFNQLYFFNDMIQKSVDSKHKIFLLG